MEKRYNPKLIEDKWRKTWEDSGKNLYQSR